MFYPRDFHYHAAALKFHPNYKSTLNPLISGVNNLQTFHVMELAQVNHVNGSKPKKVIHANNKRFSCKLFTQCAEYCSNSSMHGVRYLADGNLTWFERITWCLLISIAVIGAIYVSLLIQSRFRNSPLSTVVESTIYPVYKIPYPAVTICNYNRFDWTLVDDVVNSYFPGKNAAMRRKLKNFLALLDNFEIGLFRNFTALRLHDGSLDHIKIEDIYEKVIHRCGDMFTKNCWWRNSYIDCCDLFSLQRSEFGLCYSFNAAYALKGQENVKNETIFPRRVSSYGDWSGLRTSINVPKSYNTKPNQQGILVMVHHPFQWPSLANFIPAGTMTSIIIKPTYSYTTDRMQRLKPEQRNCLYVDEEQLYANKYHSLPNLAYLRPNCQAECRKRYLYQACKCTLDVMYPPNNNTKCKISDFECFQNFGRKFNYEKPPKNSRFFREKSHGLVCHCLPECKRIDYDAEISPLRIIEGDKNTVVLSIYFQQATMVKYRTDVALDWLDLIVSFGGIAGLFLGISLLSIVEIFFYVCKSVFACFKYKRNVLLKLGKSICVKRDISNA